MQTLKQKKTFCDSGGSEKMKIFPLGYTNLHKSKVKKILDYLSNIPNPKIINKIKIWIDVYESPNPKKIMDAVKEIIDGKINNTVKVYGQLNLYDKEIKEILNYLSNLPYQSITNSVEIYIR